MRVGFEDGGAGGGAASPAPIDSRPLGGAICRGVRGRCPRCGEGRLIAGFLRVVPACAACGTAFHHHRADDLPPYLTIVVVGHLVVAGLLATERAWAPPMWVEAAIWLPATLLLCLLLLPPIKGGVVALQWALRLGGFGRPEGADER